MLVALWLALRRPVHVDPVDVERALRGVNDGLIGLIERIEAAAGRPVESAVALEVIGSTIELDEVLHRTLAAAAALPAVDGSAIRVQRENGRVEIAVQGSVVRGAAPFLTGPPDGMPFVSGITSWAVDGSDVLRTGLVVPVGPDASGTLSVFSRNANAFDDDAVALLSTIAHSATPAIRNAFRYLEAKELAATDPRTGLRSQLAFATELPDRILEVRRHNRPLCLIQVDLDDFGMINRNYSQEVGDDVLTEFAKRVLDTIRAGDSAYRNSGGADEFFVILPDTTRALARRFYRRLVGEMEEPFGAIGAVTMSGGLAELRADDTPETLKARSGALVKQAKDGGKNQLFDDEAV